MGNITTEMAREFARDYLGTLKEKGMENVLRSVKEIASIMNVDFDTASRFTAVAVYNEFMCRDRYNVKGYINFPTLYRVWEDNIAIR